MRPFKLLGVGLMCMILAAGCLRVRLPKAAVTHLDGESEKIGWADVVHQAIRRHPDLMTARAKVKSKARTRDSAFGDYLPEAEGSFDRNRLRTTDTKPMRDSLAFDIDATQTLFSGFKIYSDFLKARRDLQAEEYAYLNTSAQVRYRLRSVYVELLKLEQLLKVNERIAERRKQNAEMIHLRYEAGREHLGSSLRADAIAEQAAFEVRQTRRQIDSQSLLLDREMGSAFQFPVRVAGNLEEMVPRALMPHPDYAALAEDAPDVRRLVRTAESYKAAVVSAQSVLWPQIEGSLNYGYSGARGSVFRDDFSLGLSVTLPFFSGGQNVEGIFKAKADYDAAWQAARSARDAEIADLADAWASLQDAIEQIKVRKQFLEAARERSEIIRNQYTSGLVNFQDFDLAEQDLADSEKAYVAALSNSLTQQANWELTKGSPLEEAFNES